MTTEHEPLGSQIAREFEELGNIKRIKINEVDGLFVPDDILENIYKQLSIMEGDAINARKHSNRELGATITTGVAISINPLLSPVALGIVYENNQRRDHASTAREGFNNLQSGHLDIKSMSTSANYTSRDKLDLSSPIPFPIGNEPGIFIPKHTIEEIARVFGSMLDELETAHEHGSKRLRWSVAMVGSSMFLSWLSLGLLLPVIYENQKAFKHLKRAGENYNKLREFMFPEEVVDHLRKLGIEIES